jgi:hypothetical protein
MKKLLCNITGWLVKKTKYDLQLPIPLPMLQTVLVKPDDLQHFKAQKAISKHEWYTRKVDPDYYVRTLKYEVAEKFVDLMQVKADETEDCIVYSVDFFYKNLNS